MARSKVVCFHGKGRCVFCWPGGRPPAARRWRRRCPACGGAKPAKGQRVCARCLTFKIDVASLF